MAEPEDKMSDKTKAAAKQSPKQASISPDAKATPKQGPASETAPGSKDAAPADPSKTTAAGTTAPSSTKTAAGSGKTAEQPDTASSTVPGVASSGVQDKTAKPEDASGTAKSATEKAEPVATSPFATTGGSTVPSDRAAKDQTAGVQDPTTSGSSAVSGTAAHTAAGAASATGTSSASAKPQATSASSGAAKTSAAGSAAASHSTASTARENRGSRRGGFMPLFLGGVIAALIGAGVTVWALPNLPPELRARILPAEEQADTFEAPLADLSQKVDALGGRVNAVDGRVDTLQTTVEGQQAPDMSGLQDQIDTLRAQLDEVTGPDAQAAEKAAQRARAQAAVAKLTTALETGAPLAPPASEANDAGLDVPETLQGAEPPRPAQLQESFDPAARAALDAARKADPGAGFGDRMKTFLLSQSGARSVKPQEGDGPNAVLSRAQAAVDTTDFKTAISEIATLPEAAQSAMADWVAQAQQRVDAVDAVQSLQSQVQ
ncbi:hypothetical protein ERN12_15210 [Rhodobacteraceae bacterium]|nr:hypothetical protein ERN12_15210 [Paracoccaceae bacterium]